MTYHYTPKEVCQKALDTWGRNPQLLMLLEEMSELQKEVLKNMNRGKDNLKELAEETADVLIMLDQLIHMYDMSDTVEKTAKFKINRLKGHLNMK
ncbi:MAG: hypothetical protein SPL08_01620 [Pseudomonadota bacterium]|nr:hypothetical protein [Pseudomonadota bacterium]